LSTDVSGVRTASIIRDHPEDSSEHNTRRRENLKSHNSSSFFGAMILLVGVSRPVLYCFLSTDNEDGVMFLLYFPNLVHDANVARVK
jgi:hypothetical protein